MARWFWERLGAERIQFYPEPQTLRKSEIEAEIAELQEIQALAPNLKRRIAGGLAKVISESDYDARVRERIEELADLHDHWNGELITETIEVISHYWMRPGATTLPGLPAGILYSSGMDGPDVGASKILDADFSTRWEISFSPAEVVIDLGYPKRIDGIRVRQGAKPGPRENLAAVDVYAALHPNQLEDEGNLIGSGLAFNDGATDGWNAKDLTPKRARYVRILITKTDHASDHAIVRGVEFRTRCRQLDN